MSMTDTIADYLTRIRNAAQAKHTKVDVPASNVKKQMTKILKEYGYINNYLLIDDKQSGLIRIYLKYDSEGDSIITGIKRVSSPGLRRYVNSKNIPRVYNNLGIAILSTPKGVISDRDARKLKVGGEVVCYVW
ncbi:30S ribosomal protein S8 [candidate division KSB1 bacterium]|nr:30S ribosomal protein S8 [candidate division KSB1 bacterium]NIR70228.1 30S ribosomal protein S8 [candidate division KSB1 bacterium]NIS26499.1 30S ribosomal protein S8 [candidate division KSB1 bacterium]NIT73261.1 30S ribosomal protein S8 [candidate division KSB1 bacterium]NIU23885.1 30S ribosomal protein S8 [candidate division KSB1 bacterium]